jgi:hypothetical protein
MRGQDIVATVGGPRRRVNTIAVQPAQGAMRLMATGARHRIADGWWADGWAALHAGGSDLRTAASPGSHHFTSRRT